MLFSVTDLASGFLLTAGLQIVHLLYLLKLQNWGRDDKMSVIRKSLNLNLKAEVHRRWIQ